MEEATRRRRFDFSVVSGMRCPVFDFQAYATVDDLTARRRPITGEQGADRASKYHFTFRVPTLVGPGRFSQQTEIGVNTDVVDYPVKEPSTWVISPDVPWSPHFLRGAPVCLGHEAWRDRKGHVTLGHLVLHLARLLNWDEPGRGPGYVGWNGAAIEYHRRHHAGKPLDPSIAYPTFPGWLSGIPDTPQPQFEIVGKTFTQGRPVPRTLP